MASIMTVHENGEQTFTVYDAAEENERDRGKVASRMVRRLHSAWLLQVRLYSPERICHILYSVNHR